MEKPINDGQITVVRNPDGTIKSGVLNPKGKKKGTKHFTTVVQEALSKIAITEKGEKIEIERALGEKVVKMALEGNEQMIKLIWNYKDGMPSQNVNISNVDDLRRDYFEKLDELNKGNSKDKLQE
jgi:hypothetical protein